MKRVYIDHIRQLGYCSSGTRQFFKRHGLDWSAFLKTGIDPQKLIDTGDHMAIKLAELAIDGR